ncbi:TerD-family protein [Streptomyces cinnamoneus]|uniref:TerD-family protein n=1 Tax=Streptomyces cinnamoneus TaxID=53446 RepID=A0A2G1XNX3_STRCJ|nr:TerD family protein [Streptomyces cinnamoneus]PHQ52937.1 TerD-family protein [Streptomyces cinnamoneus]PPT11402.1 TerD-family protein [Streptomyces cinnamoneus]
MSGLSKGVGAVAVALKWDPSPLAAPDHDLDLVAATYRADAPYGQPAYLVHFERRSPDGTITLNRDSRTGQGLGSDEIMTLELDRLAGEFVRVVVGVVIQQRDGRRTFGDVANAGVRIAEGHEELSRDDFSGVPWATAATVAEFVRDGSGAWAFRGAVRGFDAGPAEFPAVMGGRTA